MQIIQFPAQVFPDRTPVVVEHHVQGTIADAMEQLRAAPEEIDPQAVAAAALGLTLSRYILLKKAGQLS